MDGVTQMKEPTLSQIMAAIKMCQSSLTNQIDTLRVDFSLLKDDVHKIRHRVTNAEQHISTVEDDLYPLSSSFRDVQAELKLHAAKLGDLEDPFQKNNLRFSFWRGQRADSWKNSH